MPARWLLAAALLAGGLACVWLVAWLMAWLTAWPRVSEKALTIHGVLWPIGGVQVVRAPGPGWVQALHVREGEWAQAGQALLTLCGPADSRGAGLARPASTAREGADPVCRSEGAIPGTEPALGDHAEQPQILRAMATGRVGRPWVVPGQVVAAGDGLLPLWRLTPPPGLLGDAGPQGEAPDGLEAVMAVPWAVARSLTPGGRWILTLHPPGAGGPMSWPAQVHAIDPLPWDPWLRPPGAPPLTQALPVADVAAALSLADGPVWRVRLRFLPHPQLGAPRRDWLPGMPVQARVRVGDQAQNPMGESLPETRQESLQETPQESLQGRPQPPSGPA